MSSIMKRLASLDAMRGLALLGMIPFHLIFFGQFFGFGGGGSDLFTDLSSLIVVEFRPPLGTGLILFFFVAGVSLAVSLSRRRGVQSFSVISRRVILRYGVYILSGIIFELILWFLLYQGSEINWGNLVLYVLGGIGSFSAPIQGLGFGAIIAFPLILKLSWKKLSVASLVSASMVGIILYFVLLPQASALPSLSPLNPLLIGMFSALKGLPAILVGATLGKLVLEGIDVKKKIMVLGGVICGAYIIIPTLLGSDMLHMMLLVWAYPHAILFVVGSSLFLFGLFQILEARKTNLTSLKVLGRLSIFVYYGHFLILMPILQVIGFANVSIGLLLGLMIVAEIVVWVICYFYSKWRWGSPSDW